MQKIAGAFFKTHLLLMQGILSDDPNLIVSIISENSYTKKYVSSYVAEADMLATAIMKKRDGKLLSDLLTVKSIFERSIDLQLSYRNIYSKFTNKKQ